jgi:transcriptional regulator with XRE-family HTH domain
MDILANFNWDRPIYFSMTSGPDAYLGLEEYFQVEGMAYRLVPIKTKTPRDEMGRINIHDLPDKLINVFPNHARVDIVNNPDRKQKPVYPYLWGGINDPRVYIPEETSRMFAHIKSVYIRAANQLITAGNIEKAEQVLDVLNETFNPDITPYFILGNRGHCYSSINQADAFLKLGTETGTMKGMKILNRLFDELKVTFDWFEKGDERTMRIQAENIEFCTRYLYYLEYVIPEEIQNLLQDKYEQMRLPKSLMHLSAKLGAEIDYYFKKGNETQREMFDKMTELYRLGEFAAKINDMDSQSRIFSLLNAKIDLIGAIEPQTGTLLKNHFFPESADNSSLTCRKLCFNQIRCTLPYHLPYFNMVLLCDCY